MPCPTDAHIPRLTGRILRPSPTASKAALAAALLATQSSLAAVGPSDAFLQRWKAGWAEISVYDAQEERYGALRPAQEVLIFVTEELDEKTRIKIESDRIPPARHVPVLKLNRVLKFNTGIYDYSVMTSVFAGLSGPGVERALQPQKISFTSQEWCGQVYHHWLPRKRGVESELHSYFEAEGDERATIPWPRNEAYFADELPILFRELDGPFLQAGETRTVSLLPRLWTLRKQHRPSEFTSAVLKKGSPVSFTAEGKERRALPYSVATLRDTVTYFIEDAGDRRVLGWKGPGAETGVLTRTLRKAYWKRNGPENAPLREELGLRYGVDEGG